MILMRTKKYINEFMHKNNFIKLLFSFIYLLLLFGSCKITQNCITLQS